MKVLITGGAGFIGSHLAEYLCGEGHSVTVLDDLSSGNPENLAGCQSTPGLRFIEGDMAGENILAGALEGAECVFHLGANPSVPYSMENAPESHRRNLTSTVLLLELARQQKVKRIVFSSSCAVYGETDGTPNREEDRAPVLSPYALQKQASEEYLRIYGGHWGIETVSLRYFNVFGPRQSFSSPYSGVIAKFCTAMLEGQAPHIYGDGGQTRDFVYVDNVVRANALAATRPAEAVAGKVFNIASGESASLLDLVEEINRILGTEIQALFEKPRAGDIRHSAARIDRARSDLGYEPSVDWKTGLRETLNTYREQHSQA